MTFWRKITVKPWEHTGETEGIGGGFTITQSDKRVALRIFLAVVTSVFFLLFAAYKIRMEYADWRPIPLPTVLWFNTVVLVLASVAMQWTRSRAIAESNSALRAGMIISGLLTVVFIAGQLVAWNQLGGSGYAVNAGPASAFFYLMTAIHGLHILGGLWVWFRATARAFGKDGAALVKASVQLCATYWHFLLLVWLVMLYFLLTN